MMISSCRSCGDPDLRPVLSLGSMPLANALVSREQLEETEARYPLALVLCPRCFLAQITETVPPETLFRDYVYFSSLSDTMVSHARDLVGRLTETLGLGSSSLIVEIASNDGYLLQFYRQRGIEVLGIEPALNVARVAGERGIPTVSEFFGVELAGRLRADGKRADVIHAHNVLAHVADLNDFVEGIRMLLAPSGLAVIEVPYVRDMMDRCEFDTIYHEHLCYFSMTALEPLFRRHGLEIREVERIPIHGGSIRLFVRPNSGEQPERGTVALCEEERSWGIAAPATYDAFARRAERVRTSLRELLRGLRRTGHRLAAYGAAAKGATLLNYVGIDRELLGFVADRSPHKQGRFMPGTHLPILSPGQLVIEKPDYVLLLAWNLADEIMQQQARFRECGGRFIVPIPEIRIV